jgi:hypothetical protein
VRLDLAIRAVRDSEHELAHNLNAVGERHKADHDVFHLTETLQRIVRANLERLTPHARRYEVEMDAGESPDEHGSGLLERAREKTSELVGRRPEPGLLLLRDLRELHLLYAAASIDYVILEQGAKAAREADLLEACSDCHQQTLRGMKWTVTRLKTAAPQSLAG